MSCAIGPGMAFIVLRRSRNTRSYFLVESYRDDQGKTGGAPSVISAASRTVRTPSPRRMTHWEQVRERARRELRKAKGERRQVIRRRIEVTAIRIGVITEHMQLLARAEVDRRRREQQAEEAMYWQSFERLRHHPTEENARAAKRAVLVQRKLELCLRGVS